jgi:hypothetical protein
MAPVGTGDKRAEGWSRGMNITRHQIEFCFKQATQGERFSQGYCVERILELVTGASGAPSTVVDPSGGDRVMAIASGNLGCGCTGRCVGHRGFPMTAENSYQHAVAIEQPSSQTGLQAGAPSSEAGARRLIKKCREHADSADCCAKEAKRLNYPPEGIEKHARTAHNMSWFVAELERTLAEMPPAAPAITVSTGALPGCTAQAIEESGKWVYGQPSGGDRAMASARLEEAKWWRAHVLCGHKDEFYDERIAELERTVAANESAQLVGPEAGGSETIIDTGSGGYEVICPHCKEEFEVSVYPDYCVLCGEKLEREPRPPAKEPLGKQSEGQG